MFHLHEFSLKRCVPKQIDYRIENRVQVNSHHPECLKDVIHRVGDAEGPLVQHQVSKVVADEEVVDGVTHDETQDHQKGCGCRFLFVLFRFAFAPVQIGFPQRAVS